MSGRPFDVSDRTVGRLYDTYAAALFRYAAVLLADVGAAEDVVHQVFTTLLRHVHRMDDEGAYLRRAVRNACYSHLRKRREAPADDVALLETLADDGGDLTPSPRDRVGRGRPASARDIGLRVLRTWR